MVSFRGSERFRFALRHVGMGRNELDTAAADGEPRCAFSPLDCLRHQAPSHRAVRGSRQLRRPFRDLGVGWGELVAAPAVDATSIAHVARDGVRRCAPTRRAVRWRRHHRQPVLRHLGVGRHQLVTTHAAPVAAGALPTRYGFRRIAQPGRPVWRLPSWTNLRGHLGACAVSARRCQKGLSAQRRSRPYIPRRSAM